MIVRLDCIEGRSRGAHYEFREDRIGIGRSRDNQVRLGEGEKWVSGHHCALHRRRGSWILRDLGSTNGTQLNGHPIEGDTTVASGDAIRLGGGGPTLVITISEESTPARAVREARPRSGPRPGRRRLLTVSAMAVVVALLCALGVWMARSGGTEEPAPGGGDTPPALEMPASAGREPSDLEDESETPLSELPPLEEWILGRWTLASREGARVLGPAPAGEGLRVEIVRDDHNPEVYLARAREIGPEHGLLGDFRGCEGRVILRFRFLSEQSRRGGTAYFRVARLDPRHRDGSGDRFVSRNDYAWVDLRRGHLLGNVGAWLKEEAR